MAKCVGQKSGKYFVVCAILEYNVKGKSTSRDFFLTCGLGDTGTPLPHWKMGAFAGHFLTKQQ